MTHDTKHWYLSIEGLGFMTFEAASLHTGNREAYTLSAENLAETTVAAGAPISPTPITPASASVVGASCCLYRRLPSGTAAPLWSGTVATFRLIRSGGTVVGNTLTAAGAWHFLERLVYTQTAAYYFGDEAEASARQTSRIVLGQSPSGSMIGIAQQITNLKTFAASRAGSGASPNAFAVSLPESINAFQLPFDEMRDATIAQCLDRILRYVPGVVVAQRTGADRRTLDIFTADSDLAQDAAGYMDAGKVLQREDSADDSRVAGVRVEIEKVGSADGRVVRKMQEQLAPAEGTPGPGWMYITLQLSGRDSSRTKSRLDMQTEDFPADLDSAAWWMSQLGDSTLKKVVGLEISGGTRSGADDHPEWYPRIALNASPVEIEEAGLKSRVEKITCKASYTLQDEAGDLQKIVEERPLEIEVVTTSATTRRYTWTSDYSATSAEPTPEGLAQALLDQHAQDGRSISALIRLPISGEDDFYFNDTAYTHAGLPGPGDTYDGLVCQTADYDLAAHTVRVVFGPPSHVSPQDLASLMVGGRTRSTCSISAAALMTGEADGNEIDTTLVGGAGGAKAAGDGKVTRLVIPQAAKGNKKIDIDPSKIGGSSAASMEPREITYTSGTATKKAYILSTAPSVTDGEDPDEPTPPPCGHPGNQPGGGAGTPDDDPSVVDNDHPGDTPGEGFDTDHPSEGEGEDGVTPESSGECQ